jgi:protein-tyrosine phosphatase
LIDLHCHILPSLDDGAVDIDDSLEMARQAQADGIEIVCATPHIHPTHDVRVDELIERVAAVNERLQSAGVDVRVVQGGELAEPIAHERDDETLREVTLGRNGHWLLLEPPPGPLSDRLVQSVELLGERGFGCVIAHPERHPGADFREQLEALVARGALIQVTAALVAGGPAAPTMLDLATHGLVHLLGSDAHSSHAGRPVRLSAGLSALGQVERLKPHLAWIAKEGPEAILAGEPAVPPFGPA